MTTEAPLVCTNHPKRETAVRCNKCGEPICTACMIQTPVGMRCRDCAQLRKLPQFQVGAWVLARSALGGLAASVVAWLLAGAVPYLRFFLAILVGVAVGEVMTRLSKRRVNLLLDVLAVVDVLIGAVFVQVAYGVQANDLFSAFADSPSFAVSFLLPPVIASFVAVLKLR